VIEQINIIDSMRLLILLAGACLAFSAYSQNTALSCELEQLTDWGIHDAGLSLPKPEPVNFSILSQKDIAPFYTGQVKFRAAVLRADYADAQGFWDDLASTADTSSRMRLLQAMHFAMEGKGLYFLSAAQAWVKAQPDSIAAKTFYGLTLSDAAKQARGAGYSSRTSRQAMALFRKRFVQAQAVLEPIATRRDVYGWSANQSLSLGYFYLGLQDKGWNTYQSMIQAAPQYGFIYFWASDYLDRVWVSREVGERRANWLLDLAKTHRLPQLETKVLEQSITHHLNGLARQANPQASRPYWSQRYNTAPHLFNLLSWLTYERSMENWPEVVRLSTLAIEQNPYQTYSFYQRATANTAMLKPESIFADTLAAAILGNNSAMSDIIQAHVRGIMGVKPGNFVQLYEYCKLGAAFGLPAAANCMGSARTEGFAGVTRDNAQAASWHLLAARGNVSNSQHDVAALLPKFSSHKDTPALSQYWMREAAKQQHPYAMQKSTPEPELEIDTACALKLASEAAKERMKQLLPK
jgi:hypothetical protein